MCAFRYGKVHLSGSMTLHVSSWLMGSFHRKWIIIRLEIDLFGTDYIYTSQFDLTIFCNKIVVAFFLHVSC